MIKVKNNPDLRRDPYSQAIINTNESEYKKAIMASHRAQKVEERMGAMENSIDTLKDDISQIKDLLSKFMEKY